MVFERSLSLLQHSYVVIGSWSDLYKLRHNPFCEQFALVVGECPGAFECHVRRPIFVAEGVGRAALALERSRQSDQAGLVVPAHLRGGDGQVAPLRALVGDDAGRGTLLGVKDDERRGVLSRDVGDDCRQVLPERVHELEAGETLIFTALDLAIAIDLSLRHQIDDIVVLYKCDRPTVVARRAGEATRRAENLATRWGDNDFGRHLPLRAVPIDLEAIADGSDCAFGWGKKKTVIHLGRQSGGRLLGRRGGCDHRRLVLGGGRVHTASDQKKYTDKTEQFFHGVLRGQGLVQWGYSHAHSSHCESGATGNNTVKERVYRAGVYLKTGVLSRFFSIKTKPAT